MICMQANVEMLIIAKWEFFFFFTATYKTTDSLLIMVIM